MAKLNLIETIETKLPTLTKTDGQLIVIRDNASLYVDLTVQEFISLIGLMYLLMKNVLLCLHH